MKTTRLVVLAAAVAALAVTVAAGASAARKVSSCPNGQVNFGVEPYDTGAKFTAAYQSLTKILSENLGCPVKLVVTSNYTAEVEAMRAKKLDVAEFGPLGYIFAHQLAKAQPVAVFATKDKKPVTYTAAIWVPTNSTITSVAGLKGHTLALSDPASTSGNLLPLYAMEKAGLNPTKDVSIKYAGGHPQSLLALTNGQVDAAEVNSQQQATATAAGQFDTTKFKVLWRSDPLPNDPITVRGDLPAAFQAAVKAALLKMTPTQLTLVDTELGVDSGPMIAATDSMFKTIRDVVSIEHLKISQIG
ncbi:MAG: phosphate/phosphite/phosphonate ABC transporter substrate-binding protein [Actinobacteria bacterium]|nr:phosphate/phosphite/phosphonate ABC transporter substrate-binding protein [Actinomycetota bacterium]